MVDAFTAGVAVGIVVGIGVACGFFLLEFWLHR